MCYDKWFNKFVVLLIRYFWQVTFDVALNHIINCVDKLYLDSVSGKSRQEVERAQSQKSKCIEAPEGTSNPTEGN